MSKCFKMVVLEVLLEGGALATGMDLATLAARSHSMLRRTPVLLQDVQEELGDKSDEPAWLSYWNKNPIKAWSGGPYFDVDSDRLVSRIPGQAEGGEALVRMTRELVDYRLARYRRRGRVGEDRQSFTCRVTWNKRDPIIPLPNREKHAWVPLGETDVRLPDGTMWSFRFVKLFCNTARKIGAQKNQLPDLLREWFGPNAGHPGTGHRVTFEARPDGWWIEPVVAEVVHLADRRLMTAYPTLRAAAGAAEGDAEHIESDFVRLPVESNDGRFAVRASGTSMDGGSKPIRDGDWLVMSFARARAASAMENRVAIVRVPSESAGSAFQVKRLVKTESGWLLRSNNPDFADIVAPIEGQAIAIVDKVIRPESLAPDVGTVMTLEEATDRFDLETPISDGRVEGHLFVLATELHAPDRVAWTGRRMPGETAFVLTQQADSWRYAGVGRWDDAENAWAIPDVDFKTWRALGRGRSASRRLDPRWEDAAREVVVALMRSPGPGEWLADGDKRCRVVGESAKGGLRVDGGPDGMAERTVSLTDIAWVLAARDDVSRNGGVLDEARVNCLRYLEGTPKGSTRWIDTGWATVATSRRGA